MVITFVTILVTSINYRPVACGFRTVRSRLYRWGDKFDAKLESETTILKEIIKVLRDETKMILKHSVASHRMETHGLKEEVASHRAEAHNLRRR